ncbi:MAG: hypothetical protein HYV07_23005 [Deltaproteobacteria bacterium]|nr:hypothetical protein [Deltaproteobacteria bacterium]
MKDEWAWIVALGYLILQVVARVQAHRIRKNEETAAQVPERVEDREPHDLEGLDEDLGALEVRLDAQQRALVGMPGPVAVLERVLSESLRPQLAAARELRQRSVSDPNGFVEVQERLGAVGLQLAVIGHMTELRADRHLGAFLADADAIAAALLRPWQELARAGAIHFPQQRPICVPADPDEEAIWIGLLPEGFPVIFVPRDLGQNLHRWPSIAHEIGHLLWHRVPGFEREVRARLGLDGPIRLSVSDARFDPKPAFRAWISELVADAFATLMLGPAALRGLVHCFKDTADPRSTRFVTLFSDGTFEEHPPAHLRVLLSAALLHEIGFDAEAKVLLAEWSGMHGEDEGILIPVPGSRNLFAIPTELFLEHGRPLIFEWYAVAYESLGGHELRSIHGLEIGPGLWRRASDRASDLLKGAPFDDDARVIIAAAIEAQAREPGATARIEQGVRASILGLDLNERRVVDRNYVVTRRAPRGRGLLRDAMVLREILDRPITTRRAGHARPGRARAEAQSDPGT